MFATKTTRTLEATVTQRKPSRLRSAATLLVGVVATVLVAGLAFETLAAAADAKRYPPAGELVDVGGRAMHLHCTGEGGPTVVLESGVGGGVLAWAWIQPEVARETRVCSYDRAGYGWSDERPGDLNAQTVVEDLHDLLSAAGEQGPYLLVAHSLGGHYSRVYADAHHDEVLGVVLLDARNPLIGHRDEGHYDSVAQAVRMFRVARGLAEFGVMRLLGDLQGVMQPLPDGAREAAIAASATPRHLRTYLRELESLRVSDAQAESAADYGDTPLIVLAAGKRTDGMTDSFWELLAELQADLARLSSDAQLTSLAEADHVSIVTERANARAVSQVINDLVGRLRGES